MVTGERRTVRLPGGRIADVLLAGPAGGLPLVVHSGTPSGLVFWPGTLRAAAARGLRVIQVARPGYERSTPRPGRRVADVAGDVAAVLDALGCEAFLTVGTSGGGPHALACSALLRGRCLAAASVAGVAPYRAARLDWLAGMGGLISAADKAVLTGAFADHLAASLRAAVKGDGQAGGAGIAGWRDDDLAFVADWGFDLSQAGPVAVWQGSQDRMVPPAHGRWLARHIPGARARLRRADGHLTIQASRIGEVLDDLIDIAGL